MARPMRIVASAAGPTSPFVFSQMTPTAFSVGLGVALSAGAALTYTVEHTFDDVFAPNFNPATATWYPHATLAAQTASKDGNYSAPVMASRLNVTAYTSGSATFTAIQAGV